MLRETYTIVKNTECPKCGTVTECFQHYEWDDESGAPRVWSTECGYCDMDTDPRGAEMEEDLRNPEMWSEEMKVWSKNQ
jgi:hypothetical protein